MISLSEAARRGLAGLVVATACVVAVPAVAGAQSRHDVRLIYQRDQGASACPDAARMRQLVSARLGYMPFDDGGQRVLRVVIVKRQQRFVGTIAWTGKPSARELNEATCEELAEALALAISIAIDPLAAMRAPKPGPAPVPTGWSLGAGAAATLGFAPGVSPAAVIRLRARRARLSLGLSLEANLPRTRTYEGGSIDASIAVGSLTGCVHLARLEACALLSAGIVRGRGEEFVAARSVTRAYAGAGARLGLHVFSAGRLNGEVFGYVRAAVVRTTLTVSGNDVWTLPAFGGGVGAAFYRRF